MNDLSSEAAQRIIAQIERDINADDTFTLRAIDEIGDVMVLFDRRRVVDPPVIRGTIVRISRVFHYQPGPIPLNKFIASWLVDSPVPGIPSAYYVRRIAEPK